MESIVDRVRSIVAEALYLEKDEVSAGANLMQDLGAESIDFLDIMFRLEKEFSIKLPKGEIEKQARGGLSDEEFAVDGRLTPAALERVAEMLPEAAARVKGGLLVREIPSLFTVQTFANMVARQQAGFKSPAASGEGGLSATP